MHQPIYRNKNEGGAVDANISHAQSRHTALWRRSFALVEELSALSEAELAARLQEVRADDAALATSVVRMLAASAPEITAFTPFSATVIPLPRAYAAGEHVGAYTLERELGEGGMANVWLARRTDGTLTRAVAIKLPRSHLSATVLGERFVRERNVLGQLDHAHIAKIFDAGTDARGQPFLALEYIDGLPLDEYCTAHRLSLHARVALIIDAAYALHHAHSRLVLHRDIKPNNMLVTHEGALKLLDFGIAKLLSDEHTAEETEFTRLTGNALTAKYAAPEQLLSETVTTSTDVYALAVVLFELLCGESPFEDNAQTVVGRMKSLRVPAKRLSAVTPSQAFLNSCGIISATKHAREIRGDLSAIIEKALRNDAGERYPSALAFAEDLKNHLSDRPVHASQGAMLYRVQKFIQRQKIPLAIAAAGALVAVGLGVRTWQAHDIAKDSTSRAASIDGLLQGLFSGMSPDEAKSRTFTAKDLLDRTTEIIDRSAADGKYEIPSMRIGEIYRDIGAYDEAIVRFKKERAAAEKRGDSRGAFLAHLHEIDMLTKSYKLDKAGGEIRFANESQISRATVPDVLVAMFANMQGQFFDFQRSPDEANAHFVRAETLWRTLKPLNVEYLIWALEGQTHVARAKNQPAIARSKMEEVLALDIAHPVRGKIDRLRSRALFGQVLSRDANYREASAVLEPACNDHYLLLGGAHRETSIACRNSAFVFLRLGEFARAENTLNRIESTIPIENAQEKNLLALLRVQAALYRGDLLDAERGIVALLPALEVENPAKLTHELLTARRYLGEVWLRSGQRERAGELFEKIEQDLTVLLGAQHSETAHVTMLRTVAQLNERTTRAAQTALSAVSKTLVNTRGEQHPITLAAFSYHAMLSPGLEQSRRSALAMRLKNEIGWQGGAVKLSDMLLRPVTPLNLNAIPFVY